MAIAKLVAVTDALRASTDREHWDAVIVVTPTLQLTELSPIFEVLRQARSVDRRLEGSEPLVTLLPAPALAGGRLVLGLTGRIDRDFDDARRYGETAERAVALARDAGARRPLLLVPRIPVEERYAKALEVSLLGALWGLWEPLEARECRGEETIEPVRELGFVAPAGVDGPRLATTVTAIEEGKRLARDLTNANSERITPRLFAEHCRSAFAATDVRVTVVDDPRALMEGYPLLMAVARASMGVARHHPRVLRLEYQGAGPITQTLWLAGKGVTFDTGGVDVKPRGQMSGMSGDKGGAAMLAGFMATAARLAPKGLRIVAELGLVRNSTGSDGYVADEVLVSHAGVRVKVANTDAEGRLVLADLLSHLRQEAVDAATPCLFSVATLTGHAVRSVGPYTVVVENGPAHGMRVSAGLASLGDVWADPVEVSRLRREDFDFVRARSKAEDVQQSGSLPSTATERGHQFPAAMLMRASRLDQHGCNSRRPLPYVHVDVAASSFDQLDWQHSRATAAFLTTMAARWLVDTDWM